MLDPKKKWQLHLSVSVQQWALIARAMHAGSSDNCAASLGGEVSLRVGPYASLSFERRTWNEGVVSAVRPRTNEMQRTHSSCNRAHSSNRTMTTMDQLFKNSPERELVPSAGIERFEAIHSRLDALSKLSDSQRTSAIQFLTEQKMSDSETTRYLYVLDSAITALDKGYVEHAQTCMEEVYDAEASETSARPTEWGST